MGGGVQGAAGKESLTMGSGYAGLSFLDLLGEILMNPGQV